MSGRYQSTSTTCATANRQLLNTPFPSLFRYKCWFVNSSLFRLAQEETYTCSHLCHNDMCMNPAHFVIETLAVNKGRNGCAGGQACQHMIKCTRPGSHIFF